MKPTSIDEVTKPALSPVLMNTGAVVLHESQLPAAQQALSSLDFATIAPGEIIQIGFGAEQALQQTLDGFLKRLDKNSAGKVFDLSQEKAEVRDKYGRYTFGQGVLMAR
ncbi:MAG: hypothetical protein ABI852_15900, partial [Gemmatimonadaceae bacterium]